MKAFTCLFAVFAVSNASLLKFLTIGSGGIGLVNNGYGNGGYGNGGSYVSSPVSYDQSIQPISFVQPAAVRVVHVAREPVYETVSGPIYHSAPVVTQSISSYGNGFGGRYGGSSRFSSDYGGSGYTKVIRIVKGGW